MFGTSYDTSSDKFQNYYKDVSLRMKNREIDLLIVVNMFLTGFDATTLNTLWVDKNLRMHGLLQAFSRTNRILNRIKTHGNIVCFRNLEQATNDSIALFGDKEAKGLVLMKTYGQYYNGYRDGDKEVRGYKSYIDELLEKFPTDYPFASEEEKKQFIRLYGAILRLKNILNAFDDFVGNEILSPRDEQDYHSIYINLYNEFRHTRDAAVINDDIVFEMELVKQVEINIDYILMLIKKYHDGHMINKEIVLDIRRAIGSSPDLRNKKELIEQFIDSLTPASEVDKDWEEYVKEQRNLALNNIIAEEKLNSAETYKFVQDSFRDGYIQTGGTAVARILPPMSRFTPSGNRTKKKETVLDKLKAFFDKFWDVCGGKFTE